jgi:hypothetical protein
MRPVLRSSNCSQIQDLLKYTLVIKWINVGIKRISRTNDDLRFATMR